MILVTVGTQDKEFKRLFENVEELINKKIINEEVIAQAGCTKFTSDKMKIIDYLDRQELLNYMEKANYIICHGGVGTIIDALNMNKKVIVMPRLEKYHEHVNDHQLEIVEEFAKNNYILDGNNLEKAISKLNEFIPKKYQSNNSNFIKLIEDYIENN